MMAPKLSPQAAWVKSLAALTRPKDGEPMSAETVAVFASFLSENHPPEAINETTLRTCAEQFVFFPSYAELIRVMQAWVSENRVRPTQAMLPGQGAPLDPVDQSWLMRYRTRRREIDSPGYQPRLATVAADLDALRSLVRSNSPAAWARIAKPAPVEVLSMADRDAAIANVKARYGMPHSRPVGVQQAALDPPKPWKAPDDGMTPAQRAAWRTKRGLKTVDGLAAE